jgi:hypothetical protein
MTTKFLTDNRGKKTGVLLNMKEYKTLFEAYQDLQEIKIFDQVKANDEEIISWEDVKSDLKNKKLLD